MIQDKDGNYHDSRTVTAVLSGNNSGLFSRERLEKLKHYTKNDALGREVEETRDTMRIGSYIAAKFFDEEFKVNVFWIGYILRMINVPSSGSGNSKLWRESVLLHDQSIKNLHLEVAWLKPVGSVDDPGNVNRLTSTRYTFMDTVAERAAHNDLLPALSVLTIVNVTRGEYVCVSQDITDIVELINLDQAVTNFRNEISNEGDDDDDDNEDD